MSFAKSPRNRATGAFYTPRELVCIQIQILNEELGPQWWERYYVWDPAAGRGNLARLIPRKDRVILSTLEEADVLAMRNDPELAGALIFQHDFLNGPRSDWPQMLQQLVTQAPDRLIIMMNPPFLVRPLTPDERRQFAACAPGVPGMVFADLQARFIWRALHLRPAAIAVYSSIYEKVFAPPFLSPYVFVRGVVAPGALFGASMQVPVALGLLVPRGPSPAEPRLEVLERRQEKLVFAGHLRHFPTANPGLTPALHARRARAACTVWTECTHANTSLGVWRRAPKPVRAPIGLLATIVFPSKVYSEDRFFILRTPPLSGSRSRSFLTPDTFDRQVPVFGVFRAVICCHHYSESRVTLRMPEGLQDAELLADAALLLAVDERNKIASGVFVADDGEKIVSDNQLFPLPGHGAFLAERLAALPLSAEAQACLEAFRAAYAVYQTLPGAPAAPGFAQMRRVLKGVGKADVLLPVVEARQRLARRLYLRAHQEGWLPMRFFPGGDETSGSGRS